jgi:hypothetical protein
VLTLAVLVPVLRRPWRAQPTVDAFAATTDPPWRLLFVCTPGDDGEIEAVRATGADHLIAPFDAGPGDWARKINHAYRQTDDDLLLLAADDVAPRAGWSAEVRRAAEMGYGVIGTNDLGNPHVMSGALSTHPVVARWYADSCGTIDGPGRVVDEGYRHNFVDNELAGTAQLRKAWAFCSDAVVEHLHPSWGKAPLDEIYHLGRSGFDQDRDRFVGRRERWMRP